MAFIKGVFTILSDTTWPDRKQRWKDYISVLEYTAFFTIVIFIFDKLLSLGVMDLLNRFSDISWVLPSFFVCTFGSNSLTALAIFPIIK